MPKYEALFLLSINIQPGEIFEIADEDIEKAKILLDGGWIKPATKQLTKQPVEQAKSEDK